MFNSPLALLFFLIAVGAAFKFTREARKLSKLTQEKQDINTAANGGTLPPAKAHLAKVGMDHLGQEWAATVELIRQANLSGVRALAILIISLLLSVLMS